MGSLRPPPRTVRLRTEKLGFKGDSRKALRGEALMCRNGSARCSPRHAVPRRPRVLGARCFTEDDL